MNTILYNTLLEQGVRNPYVPPADGDVIDRRFEDSEV